MVIILVLVMGGYVLATAISLLALWASMGGTVLFIRPFRAFNPGEVSILIWGGLHCKISVAPVVSIPAVSERTTIITITYIIVVFSIVVQDMTLGS